MHNLSKVLMGSPKTSGWVSVPHLGDILAGTAVRRKADGTLSVTSSDGDFYGVSLGRDLSRAGYSSICVSGLGVPLLLTTAVDPAVGSVVSISNSTGLGATASATATAATYAAWSPLSTIARVGGTGVNGGVAEDGTSVGAALIDMPGGL